MESDATVTLASALAERIREARVQLTARWLERIVERVTLDPSRVFPTDDLLDHMPLLIEGIADALADPAIVLGAQSVVIDRAMELGALRYVQRFSEQELQKEYELLGDLLFGFCTECARDVSPAVDAEALLQCGHRLFRAIAAVQQATTSQFLRHVTAELSEREARLQAFHRALTHEIRNRVGATLGAGQLLAELRELPEERRTELAGVIVRNSEGMRIVLDNLLELSRVRVSQRQQRHVLLPAAAAEAVRQVRDAAERAGVQLRLSDTLPPMEVNAAAVELCLVNLLSNAVKYADPKKASRWIEVSARSEEEGDERVRVIVQVRDNGLGVPPERRQRLFERFFRAHEDTVPTVEGTGLGLSIVRDTVAVLGGRVWAEFPEGETVFAFSLPGRRAEDVVATRELPTAGQAQQR